MKDEKEEEMLLFLRDTDQDMWIRKLKEIGKHEEGERYLWKMAGGRQYVDCFKEAEEKQEIILTKGKDLTDSSIKQGAKS